VFTAGPPPSSLAGRGQALQMLQLELAAPFVECPRLTIAFSEPDGVAKRVLLHLPVAVARFLQPWILSADEYFRWWRAPGLTERQSSFQFAAAFDADSVRAILRNGAHLAVLENVDPIPTNFVAAGSLATRSGAAPPADSSGYSLMRIEVNPNYGRTAQGLPRAAGRLTVRSRSAAVADALVNALAAHFGGVTAPLP